MNQKVNLNANGQPKNVLPKTQTEINSLPETLQDEDQ
jgi:hypothetical protein